MSDVGKQLEEAMQIFDKAFAKAVEETQKAKEELEKLRKEGRQ